MTIRLKKLFLIVLVIISLIMATCFSVTFNALADDTTAPVISITDTTVHSYVGSRPELSVTAMDDVDGEVSVSYVWSSDALDQLGALNEGTHTCTITAVDSQSNQSQVTVTFIVVADQTDLSGYAFITIVCDGMDTVVKAYPLNSVIDVSAYADKEGYTKKIITSDGTIVTDLTAKEDAVLYVTYEQVQVDEGNNGNDQTNQPNEPQDGEISKSQDNTLLIVLCVVSGVLTVGLVASGVIIIISRKKKGSK